MPAGLPEHLRATLACQRFQAGRDGFRGIDMNWVHRSPDDTVNTGELAGYSATWGDSGERTGGILIFALAKTSLSVSEWKR